jgi:hypothetical protein
MMIAMEELKNQASKIKQEQEKQLDETTTNSMEQKSANEIIDMHEKEKRKLEELWYKLSRGYLIKFYFCLHFHTQ